MIYQREISNVINLQDNCRIICQKNQLLKQLHALVRALNKIDNEPGYCIFEVCKIYIRKLSDYFLTIIGEENASIENKTTFDGLK